MNLEKEVVYHGSARELSGSKLVPKQSRDLGNRKENLIKGVYATDLKGAAIAMAIISSKGVGCSSLKNKKPFGTIYEGKPTQDYIYLYHLPKDKFFITHPNKHQYVCVNPVKPIKIEKLKIKDYIHLIKFATDKEKESFSKKYNIKLK